MNHTHHWECTDTPGIFMCMADGSLGHFDKVNNLIYECNECD